MLRKATATNVRQNLGKLSDGVQYRNDNVVITKPGQPVAALAATATYEHMRRREDGKFQQVWAKFSKGFWICARTSLKNLSTLKGKQYMSRCTQNRQSLLCETDSCDQHRSFCTVQT